MAGFSASSSSSSSTPTAHVEWSGLELVPDVLNSLPSHSLLPISVQFSLQHPQSGNIRLPAYISVPVSHTQPHIQLPPFAEARKLLGLTQDSADASHYTLMMLDPDAISKSKPWLRSVIHSLHVNITDAGDSWQKSGLELAAYMGAGAPPFCGYHRYIFLLFYHTQPLPIPLHTTDFPFKDRNSVPRGSRMKFNLERFFSWIPAENKPQLIGVNYYLAQNWRQHLWGNPDPKIEEIPFKLLEEKANENQKR